MNTQVSADQIRDAWSQSGRQPRIAIGCDSWYPDKSGQPNIYPFPPE